MAPRTIEVTVRRRLFHATAVVLLLGFAAPLCAQTQDDPDLDINLAQPDFTLVALPTTLVPLETASIDVVSAELRIDATAIELGVSLDLEVARVGSAAASPVGGDQPPAAPA